MQTSPLVQHLVDLNDSEAQRSLGSVLAPFGSTHSQSRMSAAEAAGYERGRRSAEAEFKQRLAQQEALLKQELESSRRRWVEGEADKLAAMLTTQVAGLHGEISDALARAVLPFFADKLREKAVDDLAVAAEDLVSNGMPLTIEISGPADLTSILARRLEPLASVVRVAPVATPELRVSVDTRIIISRLAQWTALIEHALSEERGGGTASEAAAS